MKVIHETIYPTVIALLVGLWLPPLCVLGAPKATFPIPLEKGNQWTYDATVSWTPVGGGPIGPKHLPWRMVVLDVFTNQLACAAVVRGFPDELAWYEPTQQPGYSVLLCLSNSVYRFPAENEQTARAEARYTLIGHERSESALLLLPLAQGKEWGDDSKREDHWYRWYVEDGRPRRWWVKGYATEHPIPTWEIAYRTCPDHQVMEIAEGLGITRYIYEHHGTVASADVRLVSFIRATP